jgi:hypothetical protein
MDFAISGMLFGFSRANSAISRQKVSLAVGLAGGNSENQPRKLLG